MYPKADKFYKKSIENSLRYSKDLTYHLAPGPVSSARQTKINTPIYF